MGSQQCASRGAVVDVDGVEPVTGGVTGWDVEGVEVVPVGLDLRPLSDPESHADEDVFQLFPGLGYHVGVADLDVLGDLGEIQPFGHQPGRPLGIGQRRGLGL